MWWHWTKKKHSSKYDHNKFQGRTAILIRCYKQLVSAIVTTTLGEVEHEALG
jgi:hypothetical protein